MLTYCFRGEMGQVVERRFDKDHVPASFVEDGQHFKRDFLAENKAFPSTAGWPMECFASGVHADDAGKLRDHFRDIGVPTEVSSNGNPVYRDARHRKKALKARGFMDKSAYC